MFLELVWPSLPKHAEAVLLSPKVWHAAQQAVFKRIANRFLGYGDIDYTGHEIARYVNFLARANGVSQDVQK